MKTGCSAVKLVSLEFVLTKSTSSIPLRKVSDNDFVGGHVKQSTFFLSLHVSQRALSGKLKVANPTLVMESQPVK